MQSALMKAVDLILSQNAELMNILSVTAKMSLQSSVFALQLGLPIGIWLGACRFPGKNALILVTHSLQQARRIADEVWYFHRGVLLEHGSTEVMLTAPKRSETRQFLDFYGI